MIRSHRDLTVWQEAIKLVAECYHASDRFPQREMYGLGSQLCRAAVSVPANIAEGNGRESTKEYLRQLAIAHASLMEVDTHIVIAEQRAYMTPEAANSIYLQIGAVG